MSKEQIGNLPSVSEIKEKYSLSETAVKNLEQHKQDLSDIFEGKDARKILIIGPCSADFEESLYEYAEFLSGLQKQVEDKIKIVMRLYTGKPRTVGGWKGLQNSAPGEEPNLMSGIENSRRIAINIIEKYNLPLADELLHPQLVGYVEDIFSYFAIGARSTENQYHREVASGLDIPVGMKNPTSGDIGLMCNSIKAGQTESTFVVGEEVFETTGNVLTHGILRGGAHGPNYSLENIEESFETVKNMQIQNPALIVDCNHDNSQKQPEKQIEILSEVIKSLSLSGSSTPGHPLLPHDGDNSPYLSKGSHEKIPPLERGARWDSLHAFVKGFMVESYLYDGRQDFADISSVKKGLSLTDPCIGKEATRELVEKLYNGL